MSSCSTPWCAEYTSWQIAARIPGIFDAAIDAPTPDPQTSTPRSARPPRIAPDLAREVGIVDAHLRRSRRRDRRPRDPAESTARDHDLTETHAAVIEPDRHLHPGARLRNRECGKHGRGSPHGRARSLAGVGPAAPGRRGSGQRQGRLGHPTSVDVRGRPRGGAPRRAPPLRLRSSRTIRGTTGSSSRRAMPRRSSTASSVPRERSPRRSSAPTASSAAGSRAIRCPSCPGSTSPPDRSARDSRSASGWRSPASSLNRLPFRVWVICGDSEMAEGSMWEAAEHGPSTSSTTSRRSSTSTGSASAARRCTAGTSRRTRVGSRRSAGMRSRSTATTSTAIDAAYREAEGTSRAGRPRSSRER